MPSSSLKELLVSHDNSINSSLKQFRHVTDPQNRQEILAHFERPGWKDFMYDIAGNLRREWGLPPEPDTQAAITEFFIGVNTRHWEGVLGWQKQILDFLQLGAKDALGEVAENLHKQWEQGIPVVKKLIGGRTDIGTTLAWHGLGKVDIQEAVGINKNQLPSEQIARFLDPYFEQSEAFKIGKLLCEEQKVPLEEGVSWGIKFGFIKRNTNDLYMEDDPIRREGVFKWLNDDIRVDQALQKLRGNLEFSYSVVAIKKHC